MTVSASDSAIFGEMFSEPRVGEVFSDGRFVQHMLTVEAALARVLATAEIIPEPAADQIERAAAEMEVDQNLLAAEAARSGWPVIELVRQMQSAVESEVAPYVHWGATTQDIVDTARVMQVREALDIMEADLTNLIGKLAERAIEHRDHLMAGRTLSQQALPITFGYRVATWLAPHIRHRERLSQLRPRTLTLQFGGAVGTMASYGERGTEVQTALGQQLGLPAPTMPWHSQRDGFAELAGWLSLITGSLGKMAQDVILLAQTEIGEVLETADEDAGGSSAMPQKSNPTQSLLILASARTNAALLSAVHGALVQEHERGTHGLHVEWLTLPQMFALTASALSKAVSLAGTLVVDAERMLRNLGSSHGTLMAEALRLALLESMPPDQAAATLKAASRQAILEGRPLVEIMRETAEVQLDWEKLGDEAQYLGAAQWFIDQIVEQANG